MAVDLGGTWLRVTVPERGASGAIRSRVGPATTPTQLGSLLHAAAAELVTDPGRVRRIVIAVPTFPDDAGLLLECPALPNLSGASVSELVAEAWSVSPSAPVPAVEVVPDMAAAALGESVLGAGRSATRVLCVALGTGANAALVVDGEVRDLAFGCMGDAGHVVVEIDGPACTCGGRGCLEAACSGWALGREATALGYPDAAALVAATGEDARAAAVLTRAGTALGAAMASWSALTWPEVIAVAGGLARAGEALLGPARVALARHVAPYIGAGIRVVPAQLGDEATLAGVLLLAARLHS